jgi:hypothetical protein
LMTSTPETTSSKRMLVSEKQIHNFLSKKLFFDGERQNRYALLQPSMVTLLHLPLTTTTTSSHLPMITACLKSVMVISMGVATLTCFSCTDERNNSFDS